MYAPSSNFPKDVCWELGAGEADGSAIPPLGTPAVTKGSQAPESEGSCRSIVEVTPETENRVLISTLPKTQASL